jgi:hypothetical protein
VLLSITVIRGAFTGAGALITVVDDIEVVATMFAAAGGSRGVSDEMVSQFSSVRLACPSRLSRHLCRMIDICLCRHALAIDASDHAHRGYAHTVGDLAGSPVPGQQRPGGRRW